MTIQIGYTKQQDQHCFVININGKLFSTVERSTFHEAKVIAAQQLFSYLLGMKDFLRKRAED
jgi:hypothetical protein